MVKLKNLGVVATIVLCTLSIQGYAQSPNESLAMTLEECLEYAKENSITLQKAKLTISSSAAEEISAKSAFLPTISGSVSQGLTAYPLNDSSTSSYTGSYGVDLSMTLYSGGSNRAQWQKSQLNSEIANLELDEFENSLEVAITEVYVEILYAIEQIAAAEFSLNLSEQNEERGRAFLEVGSISSVDYAQLESATASSKYSVVVAQTQLSNLYVALKYLLEISSDITLEVVEPTISTSLLMGIVPTVADVYAEALDNRPEILSSQLLIESAELDTTIAKAGYLPTLSFTAGTGVNHSSMSSYDFSSQMRNNLNTSAGLNLSIPIFSGYRNRSNVTIAQNNFETASLNHTQVEKDLYQTIETLRNNAVNAQALFAASEYMLQASKKSMELTSEQYEVGLKSTIDLLTEQDNFTQTQQDYLTNKYQLILNKALLNFYKENIIKL